MRFSGSIQNFRKTVGLAAFSVIAAALPLSAQVSLTGAGATFPVPIYTKWFSAYQSIGNVQINYQAIGSGGGIKVPGSPGSFFADSWHQLIYNAFQEVPHESPADSFVFYGRLFWHL